MTDKARRMSRTYFSLSTKEGVIPGNICFAQSSSVYRSDVAARAMSAAFLAWTNGSRSALPNAAVSTFVRDCFSLDKTLQGRDGMH